jgi:hypothetical protein
VTRNSLRGTFSDSELTKRDSELTKRDIQYGSEYSRRRTETFQAGIKDRGETRPHARPSSSRAYLNSRVCSSPARLCSSREGHCCTSLLHVSVARLCCTSLLHVSVARLCYTICNRVGCNRYVTDIHAGVFSLPHRDTFWFLLTQSTKHPARTIARPSQAHVDLPWTSRRPRLRPGPARSGPARAGPSGRPPRIRHPGPTRAQSGTGSVILARGRLRHPGPPPGPGGEVGPGGPGRGGGVSPRRAYQASTKAPSRPAPIASRSSRISSWRTRGHADAGAGAGADTHTHAHTHTHINTGKAPRRAWRGGGGRRRIHTHRRARAHRQGSAKRLEGGGRVWNPGCAGGR